jgi:hypothetical protein
MIVFDLKCSADHVFEAWFASSSAFEDQKARGLLLCPVCGDTVIDKAVMAPNVAAKGNQRQALAPQSATPVVAPPSPEAAAVMEVMQKLAAVQAEAIKTSTWVGKDFERQARAMDSGEADQAQIHGQATPEQARAMMEDGIGVMPLLIPIVPPEECN